MRSVIIRAEREISFSYTVCKFIATVVTDRCMKWKYLLPVWKVAYRQSRFPLHAFAYYMHTSDRFFNRPCSMKNSRRYLFSTCLPCVLRVLIISSFFILIKQFPLFFKLFFTFFHSVHYGSSQHRQTVVSIY